MSELPVVASYIVKVVIRGEVEPPTIDFIERNIEVNILEMITVPEGGCVVNASAERTDR